MYCHEILDLHFAERIGIMGGTFDPVHQGHLVTAEAVRSEFQLDKVIFVPSGKPPHKKEMNITAKEYRYLMTVLATADNPFFEVSRVEIDRPGDTYAIDTVRFFNKTMPGSNLFFITGADAILEIASWKDMEELLERCTFIAATRPGFDLNKLNNKIMKTLKPCYLERIILLEVPAMAISSTDIRQRVKDKRTIKYLLPEAVEKFIDKKELYAK